MIGYLLHLVHGVGFPLRDVGHGARLGVRPPVRLLPLGRLLDVADLLGRGLDVSRHLNKEYCNLSVNQFYAILPVCAVLSSTPGGAGHTSPSTSHCTCRIM